MEQLKKPAEESKESLGRLVKQEVGARRLTTVEFARSVGMATKTALELLNGTFPAGPVEPTERSIKFISGRVATLTRVCRFLELDLQACLAAAGLPEYGPAILKAERGYGKNDSLLITAEDIEKLGGVVKISGPIPIRNALDMIAVFHKNT